jgi:hypothetical protein
MIDAFIAIAIVVAIVLVGWGVLYVFAKGETPSVKECSK